MLITWSYANHEPTISVDTKSSGVMRDSNVVHVVILC